MREIELVPLLSTRIDLGICDCRDNRCDCLGQCVRRAKHKCIRIGGREIKYFCTRCAKEAVGCGQYGELEH